MSLFAVLCFVVGSVVTASADDRPNIVVLLADDLGYADLGCYGGEIDTPHLDAMAADGLQFSRFRATPMCVTSRTALLAGMPFNRAGRVNYAHSTPLPITLKRAGYRTLMTGKWHAGQPDPRSNTLFDRSFGFLGGATDSFRGGKDWFLGDKSFTDFTPDFYSTAAFADRSIAFMQEAVQRGEPFFMYTAFNAPHHPCQAPEATVRKYRSRFRSGYEAIRAARHARQIERGLIDEGLEMAPQDAAVRRWNDLTDHRKNVEVERMAAYAAAVDEVDQAVGRILNFLKESQLDENTFVVFLSDNGGDYSNGGITTDEKQVAWKPGSNPSSSNGWAAAKCTPFRFYKHACHEGGLAVPCIIRWPAGTTRNVDDLVHEPASILDFYPTFVEMTGAAVNDATSEANQRTLTGASLLPLLTQDGERSTPPLFSWFHFSKSWTEDEWKAVSLYGGPWQLFDLRSDRGEATNVAAEYPERLTDMVTKWETFARESDIEPSDEPAPESQAGWGWHRLQMACPSVVSLTPANGSVDVEPTLDLELAFDSTVDFRGSSGRSIRLYEVGDETNPIWQASPTPEHSSQGQQVIRFDDVPQLKPNHHYAIRWDPGWVKVGNRPVGPLNDGAYWWRFRTR